MKKEEFLENFLESRKELSAHIRKIEEHNDFEKIVNSDWKVKDVLAHINWYDTEQIEMLKEMKFEGSKLWNTPEDKRNEMIREVLKDIQIEKIIDLFHTQTSQLEKLLKRTNPQAFHSGKYFAKMKEEWEPWKIIAGNTFRHYVSHSKSLKANFDYL